MGNLGGMEVVVILLVALIVLGPTKLPEAARQVGKAVTELRRISGGFQRELREAMQEPLIEADARAKGAAVSRPTQEPAPSPDAAPDTEAAEPAANGEASPTAGSESTPADPTEPS